jgi:hypothetical protein
MCKLIYDIFKKKLFFIDTIPTHISNYCNSDRFCTLSTSVPRNRILDDALFYVVVFNKFEKTESVHLLLKPLNYLFRSEFSLL